MNRDLPDLFGLTSNLAKAIFGAIVVGGITWPADLLVHALFRRYNPKDYKRMSLLQYSIVMFFWPHHGGPAAEDGCSAWMHIKYVWITPWFNV